MMKYLLLLIFMAFSVLSIAQRSVSGTVLDAETKEPLPGVTLMVIGDNTKGTITDYDGKYTLESMSDGDVLIVSFIGFKTQEVEIGTNSILDISLELNVEQLEEVVVIGYGTQKKKVVTGSIESVTAEEIVATPVVRVDQALQGRAAGVQLLNQSGQPGEKPAIRIRGIGTDGNANPLILVDGMQVASIDNINPADIESMEVLKDAASTSIYGARAANGVVLITTKGGVMNEKFAITYSGYVGVQNAAKKVDLLNANQYQQVMSQAGASNLSGAPIDPNRVPDHDTDWQEELFTQNAPIVSHYIGVQGSTEKTSFSSSVSYFNQEGIIGGEKSKFERYTARLTTRTQANKIFEWGNTLSYTQLETRGVTSNGSFNGAFGSALNLDPLTPVFETDPDKLDQHPYSVEPVVKSDKGYTYAVSEYVAGEIVNPVARLELQNQIVKKDQFLGNVHAQMEPISGLKFKTSLGADISFLDIQSHRPLYFLNGTFNNTVTTGLSHEMQRLSVLQWENVVNYTKRIGKHNFNLLAGTTVLNRNWQMLVGGGQGVDTSNPNLIYLNASVDSTQTAGGSAMPYRLSSIFSRLLYDFNDRISLSVTYRRDGSSNFGSNNKFGHFWSFGTSWVISDESFFPTWQPLSLLKLRVSYGGNGNDRIGEFQYASTVDFQSFYSLASGAQQGAIPGDFANQDIKWESSVQLDLGLELGLFNDQFTATLDYYKKTTSDLLQTVTYLASLGQDVGVANIGEMVNEGFEISAQWRSQKGDLGYSLGLNAAYNQNTMTKVANDAGFIVGADWALAGEVTRTFQGHPVVSFFGFETDGIFQSQNEVFSHINKEGDLLQPNAQPGDIRFVDVDGDGRITDDDRTIIGSPLPDWTVGSNFSLSYKNFELSGLFTGQFGLDIFNGMNRPDITTSNRQSWILDQWTETNASNDVPRLVSGDPNENYTRATDMVNIEDGAYLRLKNVQLGYNLPGKVLGKIHCQDWRVYVSVENALTFTNYSGADPEVGSVVDDDDKILIKDTGIDRGIYPQSRTFRVGTTFTF